jgi:hypothetical protein
LERWLGRLLEFRQVTDSEQYSTFRLFEQVGDQIERRWREANYRLSAFPEIAVSALELERLHERVHALEVVDAVLRASQIPAQEDLPATFGAPPITLYRGGRFFISALYWLDGTTSIHQHRFSGAFQVLAGSSIQGRYMFAPVEEVSDHLLLGTITFDKMEVLRAGDVRPILSGRELIHSVFHLDRPSVSIVVRTYQDDVEPQFSYHVPGVAADPFLRDPLMTRRLQAASMLLDLRTPDADRRVADLLRESDLHTCFSVLQRASILARPDALDLMFDIESDDRFQGLLETARSRHGELVHLFPRVFDEQRRQSEIVRRRATITEPHHRFFLALLLHGVGRSHALELVSQWEPSADPVELLVDWIDELSRTRVAGSSEPNVLGLEVDEELLSLAERLLAGEPVSAASQDVLDRLRRSPLRPLFAA